mmetsp:Transcript_6056/g.6967  ORF Transcript_6056/g.6967 Transcript_6056/m.6967 type:complete len:304 (-) Transcript_6056:1379-2290(-)
MICCNCLPKYYWNQAFHWPNAYVLEWLMLLGLETYCGKFRENGVDGETLLKLKNAQFTKDFDITDELHKNSLRLGLKALRARAPTDYSNWEWSCERTQVWLRRRGLELVCAKFERAAIHGHSLFVLKFKDFDHILTVEEDGKSPHSVLVLRSLWLSIRRAERIGTSEVFPEKSILDWGPKQIRQWLYDLNLVHLVGKFRRHGINGSSLLTLKQKELEQVMGLTKVQASVIVRNTRRLRSRLIRNRKKATVVDSLNSVEYATVQEKYTLYKTENLVEVAWGEGVAPESKISEGDEFGYHSVAPT